MRSSKPADEPVIAGPDDLRLGGDRHAARVRGGQRRARGAAGWSATASSASPDSSVPRRVERTESAYAAGQPGLDRGWAGCRRTGRAGSSRAELPGRRRGRGGGWSSSLPSGRPTIPRGAAVHGPSGSYQRAVAISTERRIDIRPIWSELHVRATLESSMDDLYRDYILEHYRRPHNFGVIEDADASYEGANPLCGDRITLMLGVTGRDRRPRRVHRPRLRHQPGQRQPPDRRDQGQADRRGRRHPRRRPARPARHRHQPGPPQVRDAQPRQPPARPRRPGRRDAGRAADAGMPSA